MEEKGLYKGTAPVKNGACNLEEKERKKNKLYSFILELLKEHMILGLDQGV